MGQPRKKRKQSRSIAVEAMYICDSCGEGIVIPVDPLQGELQEYVEDCPVCCSPHVIHIVIDEREECRAWAERE